MLAPAESPTTSKRPGNASTIRRTLHPTEPVDPRMERPRWTKTCLKCERPRSGAVSPRVEEVIVQDGRAQQQAVEAVQHAPMAREERARVLPPRPALQEALGQIAGHSRHRHQQGEDDG